MVKLLLLLFFSLPIISQAQAQNINKFEYKGKQTSLQDFLINNVKIIKKDNRDLVVIPLKPLLALYLYLSSNLKISELDTQIAQSKFREIDKPKLTWNTYYETANNNILSSIANESTSFNTFSSNTINTGINHQTRSGINYGIQISSNNVDSTPKTFDNNQISTTEKKIKYTELDLNFQVNIPIGKGFGKINYLDLIQAQLNTANTQRTYLSTIYNLVEVVINAYWELVAIYSELDLAIERVAESRRIVTESEARFELGIVSENFLLRSKNQLENDINLKAQIYVALFEIEEALKIAINIKNFPYGIFPKDEPQTPKLEDRNIENYLDNLANCPKFNPPSTCHPDYVNLEIAKNSSEITKIEADNEKKIDLDLSLVYNIKGLGQDNSQANSVLNSQELSNYTAKLTWSYPLGGSKSTEKNLQYNLESMKLGKQALNLRDNYELQLKTIIKTLDFLSQQLDAIGSNILLLNKIYEQEQFKYKIASGTRLNILEAKTELYSALANRKRIEKEYEKKFYLFKLIVGELFDYLGIDLDNIKFLEILESLTFKVNNEIENN